MDALLGKLTSQAMNYAIRSGITITTTYAINQCTRLLKQTPKHDHHRQELLELQIRLESKIRIISPAIDMIELISARGNTMLESAVSLTKELRFEIQRLGAKVKDVVESKRSADEVQLRAIMLSMKLLLAKIEDAIPLINLAITTSGVNLTTKLSGTISPSRLLQASTFLVAADANYTIATRTGGSCRQQVGPTWTLTLYMLFAGHANRPIDEAGIRDTTWKEVIHKARVKLVRVALDELYLLPGERQERSLASANQMQGEETTSEFAYQILVIEDLDDGRVHTFEDSEAQPGCFDDVSSAGIRDIVPIHEISKVFYADTRKILNIGSDDDDVNNPVLLIKRDVHAEAPRKMMSNEPACSMGLNPGLDGTSVDDEQSEVDAQILRESTSQAVGSEEASFWRLPDGLDPEWMAFEVYNEEAESAGEDDIDISTSSQPPAHNTSHPRGLNEAMSNLAVNPPHPSALTTSHLPHRQITTTLSLLEMLLKLTSLQQFRQESHLSISDELLNFFLEDSATAGAGADKHFRRQIRNAAVQRLGFDPYDESPVKRRGEQYIARAVGRASSVEKEVERGLSEPPEWLHPALSNEEPCQACGSPMSAYSPPGARSLRDTPLKGDMPQRPGELGLKRHGAPRTLAKGASQGSLLATPPSTSKSEPESARAQSESKRGSPPVKPVDNNE